MQVLLSRCNFIQIPMIAPPIRPLIQGCPEGAVVGLGLRLRLRGVLDDVVVVVIDDRDEVVWEVV